MHLLRHLKPTARPRHLGMAAAVLLISGCAASLQGPTETPQSRTVHLLEHGRHSSLLLTAADNSRVRYAYGDWAWYVEEETGMAAGARALLRESPAGLGRQRLPPARSGRSIDQDVGLGIKRIYRFEVPADRVDALIQQLDAKFERSDSPPYFSEARQLNFVPHPRSYTFGYNSNHMVADWLQALDVEVNGNPAIGRWRLQGGGSVQ
jgi:hypothetical protein